MDRLGVASWLKKYEIINYTINEDLSVDVGGDVSLLELNIVELPVKFRTVSGNFTCSQNKLISLVGCPSSVGGDFACNDNKLEVLDYCPEKVDGKFYCIGNKNLADIFNNMSFHEIKLYVKNKNLNESLSIGLVDVGKGVMGKKI